MNLINTMSQSISNVRMFANQTEDETMKSVSITKAIEEASELVSYELKNRDIKIDVSGQEQLPAILANPLNIQQVFVTLIKSYWEHFDHYFPDGITMENWDKRIRIDLKNIAEKWIAVKLQDNIDLDLQTYLKPKDHKTGEKRRNSGLDLHLATAQFIITSLGGDLRINRHSNGSLLYTIRIPVDQSEERDELYNLIEMLQD
jgi:C4-dicarboxylate-specific signal transduction histidine kinase